MNTKDAISAHPVTGPAQERVLDKIRSTQLDWIFFAIGILGVNTDTKKGRIETDLVRCVDATTDMIPLLGRFCTVPPWASIGSITARGVGCHHPTGWLRGVVLGSDWEDSLQ